MYNKKGFTLIELLVVVAIIGILATIVTMSVIKAMAKSNYTKTLADMTAIADAVKLYHAEENVWPTSDYVFPDVVTDGTMKDFLTTKLGTTVSSTGVLSDYPTPPCDGARYGIITESYVAVVYFPSVNGPDHANTHEGKNWAVAQVGIEGGGFPEISQKTNKSITCSEYNQASFE